MPIPAPTSREDFKITIICALTLEAKAVLPLFDVLYDENLDEYRKAPGDQNAYTLGSIGRYHAVLAYMPGSGKGYASSVATNVKRSYPCLELALVVGVCGGVPYVKSSMSPRQDIFLGDVIVSKGVVQYDLGRRHPTGFVRKNSVLANLPRPSPEILSFLNKLEVGYERLTNRLANYLVNVQTKFPSGYPGTDKDRLFGPEYAHQAMDCKCTKYTYHDNSIVARRRDLTRHDQATLVHFGLIASGDAVMMSAHERDQISEIENIIGFEMEGAGVWDNLPCIVIKGVSDYADSHKTKEWQHFAAASAAACTRAILDEIPVSLPKPSAESSNNHSRVMPVVSCKKRPAAEMSESGYKEDEFYIESLTFPQAQFRLEEISSAHEKTCEWILGRPEYLTWTSEEALPSHGGFFWIKGKPGAGKSTLMKHSLGKIRHGNVSIITTPVLHSKGVPPDAEKAFLNVAKSLELQDGNLVWTKRDVKNLLSLTIKSLQGHHILFLIDAVDECDQAEVEDMTTFFQELGKSAVEHTVYLRICLASRHYPHITLDKGIEFIVEDQHEHEDDLRRYVETKLKGGRSSLVQDIRNDICKRADGVFLWVMLVVRSLNEAFDRGNISALQKRLNEIPDGLDDLFTDILTRDQKDMDVLTFSLQLILLSCRCLTREELYFAVLFEKTKLIEEDVDWTLHSTTVMDRLVLDVTKGLAESAKQSGRAKPHRVRFIHESVRDFLLRRNGFTRIRPKRNDSASFIGDSHDRLKQVCFNYISRMCQAPLGQEIVGLRDPPQRLRDDESIQKAFPFLDYAIRRVLKHSNLAQAEGISQKEFLRAYSNRFSDFKRVYNAVEKYTKRQYKDDWSLLYIMVKNDLRHLIPVELLGESRAWDLCGQYLCPMGAAFRNGNMAYVRALLGMQPDDDPHSLNVCIEPEMVSRMKQFFAEFDGQTRQSRSKVRKSQRLLAFALEGRCVSILRLLLFANVIDFNDTLNNARKTPLSWSIYNSEPDLVEFLVSEAKVNIQAELQKADSTKGPLLRAAFRPNTELKRSSRMMCYEWRVAWRVADRRILDILLRQESLDLMCQDDEGKNAVHWAALADDKFSLKRLIGYGFDYEHCDSTGRDPLSYAAECGHVDIVKALLEMEEIEVDRRDRSGRTPLTWVVAGDGEHPLERTKSVVEALFNTHRVDFNAKDKRLQSPLARAVGRYNSEGAEVLLNFDTVDVNSRDLYGRTPLIMAVISRQDYMVKILLRCDKVDVDAQDADGRTALSWAIGPLNFPCTMKGSASAYSDRWGSYIDVVKVLLAARTPDTGLADIWGHPPTWWEQAYRIILAELGERYEEMEDCASSGAALVPTDSKTIKSEMQRFLEGEHMMKSPVEWDLLFHDVKFGANWVLEGTKVK
ncbi:uncharacterized protein N7482_007685 [Penicillium canariense]|uniref:Nucleoside phosphorylase domain-containing protein n=1 Tax=Penicillium canariense TaxID=189055 RepID=A0A9W9LKU4_9EURO|nr:uncharacterized protein N7482_007685 [Penicillium canariense]KAJ5160681.1 hypothetical protein N7482_007685 [Penicillium canariense]